jgi:hypothetical protein
MNLIDQTLLPDSSSCTRAIEATCISWFPYRAQSPFDTGIKSLQSCSHIAHVHLKIIKLFAFKKLELRLRNYFSKNRQKLKKQLNWSCRKHMETLNNCSDRKSLFKSNNNFRWFTLRPQNNVYCKCSRLTNVQKTTKLSQHQLKVQKSIWW